MLTFDGRPVCDAEARDVSVVEPWQVQGHVDALLHLDPGHGAVATEGSNLDRGGIDAAADGVCDSIRAAVPGLDLPQARQGELQLQTDSLVSLHVPDESPVEGGQP